MDPKNSKKPEDILNGDNSNYLEYLQNMYIKETCEWESPP